MKHVASSSEEQYIFNPRDFALDLVEQGLVTADTLLLACLNYMSHDDVRGALDANELSPRFIEDNDDE